MAILMNLNSGGTFSAPGGFPVRLVVSGESMLSGVIPRGVSAITAALATESGIANAHLALFTMPVPFNTSDLAVVAQADLVGLSTKTGQTISLAVPTSLVPVCYVVRLWIDGITGSVADTISRDGATVVTNEPKIPTGVLVSSVVVS